MLNKILVKFLFLIIFFIFSTLYSRTSLSRETEMVLIPSGNFIMRADLEPDQSSSHEVFLDSFYIDAAEEYANKVIKDLMVQDRLSFKDSIK